MPKLAVPPYKDAFLHDADTKINVSLSSLFSQGFQLFDFSISSSLLFSSNLYVTNSLLFFFYFPELSFLSGQSGVMCSPIENSNGQ